MDEITAEIERDTDEDEAGKRPRSSSDSSNNTLAGSPSKQQPPCKKPALETPTTREEEREPALETHTTREEEMEQALETSPEVEKEDSSNNTSPPKQPPTTRELALKTPTGREVEMMESRVSSSKALNKRLTRRELQNLDTTAPAPKVLDFCAGGAGEGEEEQVKCI